MSRIAKHTFLRRVALLLLVLQMHLLWVAVVHSHESPEDPPGAQSSLHENSNGGSASTAGSHYCVVCQIVRQGAIRPAVAHLAPRPATLIRLRPGFAATDIDSRRPAPTYGRAPPLA